MGTERRPQKKLCPDINDQAVVSCYLFSMSVFGTGAVLDNCLVMFVQSSLESAVQRTNNN
jgi:hypothetical protein